MIQFNENKFLVVVIVLVILAVTVISIEEVRIINAKAELWDTKGELLVTKLFLRSQDNIEQLTGQVFPIRQIQSMLLNDLLYLADDVKGDTHSVYRFSLPAERPIGEYFHDVKALGPDMEIIRISLTTLVRDKDDNIYRVRECRMPGIDENHEDFILVIPKNRHVFKVNDFHNPERISRAMGISYKDTLKLKQLLIDKKPWQET